MERLALRWETGNDGARPGREEEGREATSVEAQDKVSFSLVSFNSCNDCRTRSVSPPFEVRKLKLRRTD